MIRLRTMMGDHPVTAALKSGAVASSDLALDFADVKVPNTAFKRAVRDLEFDVAELAIVTFLIARAAGKPLLLLPAVLVSRMQHSFLVHNAERGALAPRELEGRRVGVRSYSVTTGMWVRAILAGDFGVATDRINWVTFEEPHVAEFKDPPNVERAPAGSDIEAMLLSGGIDAAILGKKPGDPRIQPLLGDLAGAEAAWTKRTGAIQINHMVAVRESLGSETAREVYRMLLESRHAADDPAANPFGVESNRHSLEVAIDCVWRQNLIPRRYAVGELFGGYFD